MDQMNKDKWMLVIHEARERGLFNDNRRNPHENDEFDIIAMAGGGVGLRLRLSWGAPVIAEYASLTDFLATDPHHRRANDAEEILLAARNYSSAVTSGTVYALKNRLEVTIGDRRGA